MLSTGLVGDSAQRKNQELENTPKEITQTEIQKEKCV